MPTCFRGWRRKFGVMALVVACLFAAWWVRSNRFDEWIVVSGERSAVVLMSNDTGITIENWPNPPPSSWPIIWKSVRREISHSVRLDEQLRVPYWSIVVPLTMLSAYLLLSKPRAAKPPTNAI